MRAPTLERNHRGNQETLRPINGPEEEIMNASRYVRRWLAVLGASLLAASVFAQAPRDPEQFQPHEGTVKSGGSEQAWTATRVGR